MSQGLTPPSMTKELSSLKKRVSDLERRLDALLSPNQYLGIPFSLGGELYLSESSPWSSPIELRVATMVAMLGTAGTTTTTVAFKVNGITVTSLSLGAGEKFKRLTLSKSLAPDIDFATIAITAVGSGAANLDVIIRFA